MIPDQPTSEIEWPTTLYKCRGAAIRLGSIPLFYDFRWLDRFNNTRRQFRNGKVLATLVRRSARVANKQPALLLTRDPSAREGRLEHPDYFVVVVNIDRYLERAAGDAATTYFSMLHGGLNLSGLRQEDLAALSESRIDTELLRMALNADPDRIEQVALALQQVGSGVETVVRGRERETVAALARLLGDEVWQTVASTGVQIPALVAHRAVWEERRRDVEALRTELDAGQWTEPNWQQFFENRTWIFGYGLRYQFLHQLQSRPHVGGRQLSGQGAQESDFLLATDADVRFTVLVEIKSPNAELTGSHQYRNHVHPLGQELTSGVAQLQQEAHRWVVEGCRQDHNRDLLDARGIFTHTPKCILVIGQLRSLNGHRDRIGTFEAFRRNLQHPEILTYDELLSRAQHIVDVGLSESLDPTNDARTEDHT